MSRVSKVYESSMKMLLATGLWPQQDATFLDNSKAFLSYSNFFLMMTLLGIELYDSRTSIVRMSEILFVFSTFTAYCVKMFSFRYKKTAFLNLIDSMQELDNYPKGFELESHMIGAENVQRRLATTYRWICASCMSCFALFPLLDEDKTFPLPFPYFHDGLMRIVVYVFMISGLGTCAWNNSCLDLLPTSFMAIAAASLDILNDQLANTRSSNVDERKVIEHLLYCAERYDKIIKYVKQIEQVFTVGFLAQFLGSTFVICNTGFHLLLIPWVSMQFLTLLLYFAAMMTELTMICWFGNEVILKSLKVCDSCYMLHWYNYGHKVGKILFIIMERSKRPLSISTYKFSTLSLTAFTSIMHWSYSYFTLLRKLYRKY